MIMTPTQLDFMLMPGIPLPIIEEVEQRRGRTR
jgi:hypothetical protein